MWISSMPTELVSGIVCGVALVGAYLSFRSVYRVEQGHLGVLTTFGAADFADEKNKKLNLVHPGLHFKWPWQEVKEFSVMERITDLASRSNGFNAIAEDGTILKLDAKLRIQPVQENLYAYLFEMRNPVQHIQQYFKCLLRHEIANFRDSYSGIRKSRQLLNQKIADLSKVHIGTKYGVKFNAVDIVDIVPPEELDRALNAVQNAQAEADALYSRALADRDQRLTAAQQAVDIAVNRARAVETEIQVLGSHLGELKRRGVLKEYLERRRVEVYADAKMAFVNQKGAQ